VEFTTIHTNVKIISEVDSNYFKIVKKRKNSNESPRRK